MMKFNALVLLAPVILLAGCADKPNFVDLNLKYITTDSAPVTATDQKSQAMLAEAAQSVNGSMQQISAIELATNPEVKMPQPENPVAIGMAQQTALDWNGPVEPLLQKIAEAANYKVRVLGRAPAIPALINIDAKDQPLANILRDTTYQVRKFARISLYPKEKVIELRYLNS